MSGNLPDDPARAAGCPHAARAAAERRDDDGMPVIPIREDGQLTAAAAGPPELFTFAQVDRIAAEDSPLRKAAAWMRQYLARPHRELGRPGPVCPFVPGAIAQDTIWLGSVALGSGDRQAIVEIIRIYRELFLRLEPQTGELAMMKAMLIVFPNVPSNDAGVIDEVQAELKAQFVDAGLMIGEFHERNESPGLRNPDFRPLRSPIPSLAIRHMVETDLPFLHRPLYDPATRVKFIRSYLRVLGSSISRTNFDVALDSLVTAEIDMRRVPQMEEVPVAQ